MRLPSASSCIDSVDRFGRVGRVPGQLALDGHAHVLHLVFDRGLACSAACLHAAIPAPATAGSPPRKASPWSYISHRPGSFSLGPSLDFMGRRPIHCRAMSLLGVRVHESDRARLPILPYEQIRLNRRDAAGGHFDAVVRERRHRNSEPHDLAALEIRQPGSRWDGNEAHRLNRGPDAGRDPRRAGRALCPAAMRSGRTGSTTWIGGAGTWIGGASAVQRRLRVAGQERPWNV